MVYLDKIEGLGGAVAAIPFMQREIQDAAYRYQQEVESRARIVVGVNEFATDAPPAAAAFRVDPAVEASVAERLADLRRQRDHDRAAARWTPWSGRLVGQTISCLRLLEPCEPR